VYDCCYIPYDPLEIYKPIERIKDLIGYGRLPTVRGYRIAAAAVLMHELGHSIGISPWSFGGCDNFTYGNALFPNEEYARTWSNYYSVMNYQVMYRPDLLDYSDGSNGPPYDQNDWEKLFVASYQYNDVVIEEPFFSPPVDPEKIVWGETETGVTDYVYDENLTMQFEEYVNNWSPVEPIKVNWMVFKVEDKEKNPTYKDVKILVQPYDVPFAKWAEYAEGDLDPDNNIKFYSQQEIIDEVLSQISS
jgi:hypothetical protein